MKLLARVKPKKCYLAAGRRQDGHMAYAIRLLRHAR